MFDFPASPSIGDVSNGYVFNGTGWAGGAQAGPVTEQFFDPVGLVNLDIPVPTWAKGVQIEANIYVTGGVAIVARVSFDGTTFATGAGDYTQMGPTHATGTGAYSKVDPVGASYMMLSGNADSATVPHSISATMSLTRATTAQYFSLKSYAKIYDSTATYGYRTTWIHNIPGAGITSALSIKALRFMHGTGGTAFPAGSFIRVKWLGNSAEIPQSNAIAEAPQTGGEYVRVNGLWRLKSQTLILDGLGNADVAVPAGARIAKIAGVAYQPNVTATSVVYRVSVDGTTFLAGAADYYYMGMIHYTSGAGTYANLPGATNAYGLLTYNGTNVSLPHLFNGHMQLTRPVAAASIRFDSLFTGQTFGTQAWATNVSGNEVMDTNLGSALAVKALRFYLAAGGNFGNGSYIDCEWVY